MSQLNNDNNGVLNDEKTNSVKNLESNKKVNNKKEKKIKKKHPTRNMIIFLLVFTLICASVTTSLIIIKKSKKNNTQSNLVTSNNVSSTSKSQVVSDGLGLKSLDDTYKGNNLEIKHLSYTDGSVVDAYNRHQIEVNYVQINGLKNKGIEENINKEIKDKVDSLRAEYGNNVKYLSINASCRANFEDVLSIAISTSISYSDNDYDYKVTGLNYELASGNKIKFNELFTSDAAIKSILSKSAYDTFTAGLAGGESTSMDDKPVFSNEKNYNGTEYGEKIDASKYEEVEEKVFKLMTYYNSGNEIDFSFSPRTIKVYLGEDNVTIPIKLYYNQVAIYNRFKSDTNIYDGVYSPYIENNQIPVLLPTNNSGVALDIIHLGGYSGISYLTVKKSGKLLLYVDAYATYSEEERGMVFDKQVASICMKKAKEIMNEYSDNGKSRVVSISIQPTYYYFNGQHEGDYYISVTEYTDTKNSDNKFISEVIDSLQNGYEGVSSSLFGAEGKPISETRYAWVYYKDTNSWRKFSEDDELNQQENEVVDNTQNHESEQQINENNSVIDNSNSEENNISNSVDDNSNTIQNGETTNTDENTIEDNNIEE